MKKFKILIVLCLALALGSSMVYAGTSFKTYSTTVPKLGGSGYTATQTKTTGRVDGDLKSTNTGGYKIRARMEARNTTILGPWTEGVFNKGEYILRASYNHSAKDTMRVEFENSLITVVSIQSEGKWRSN